MTVHRAPSGRLYRRFLSTVAATKLSPTTPDDTPVTSDDLAHLPTTAQRYLRFMGVEGHPRVWSFRAHFTGRFRRQPDRGWMPCQAWQYNTAAPISRVFHMHARFAHLLPMVARDTYVHGRGRMHGKLLDLITVVDGTGDEFDVGELTTYLNDATLLAPSMLLGSHTTWTDASDDAFDIALTHEGRTVAARVFIDDRGAPYNFTTTDRFAALPDGLVRAEWATPVKAWTTSNGRPIPADASAVWHLPGGPFTYIEGRYTPDSVSYDMPATG
jgi:hypothetical protein